MWSKLIKLYGKYLVYWLMIREVWFMYLIFDFMVWKLKKLLIFDIEYLKGIKLDWKNIKIFVLFNVLFKLVVMNYLINFVVLFKL